VFNLSGSEIIVILLLALVVLGPEKLPDALRRAGRTYAELKKMGNSFQSEMKSVLDEPMREMRETADLLKKSVDFTDGELTGTRRPSGATSATNPPPTPSTAAAPADPAPAPAGPSTDPTAPAPGVNGTDAAAAPPAGARPGSSNGSSPDQLSAQDDLINRTLSGEP
jgi:sec-independent protein translocase protein TatB